MNILLIFFALPIATIILSVILQKILKCPILVAATFFAIYLIVTFAVLEETLWIYGLVLTIVYTIISYITAYLTCLFCRFGNLCNNCKNNENQISDANADLAVASNNNVSCNCRSSSNTQDVVISASLTPNSSNNGRTGCIRGCYRRR